MVTVEKAIIAKLSKGGKQFEVLVDSEMAYDFRSGKAVSVNKMLAVGQIFTDAKKGDRVVTSDLEKAFGTSDVNKVTEVIVKTGEIQLTTEFRRKKTEEKRKQIATMISRAAIDPRTKVPHPPDRVLNAMEQAHVNVDPFVAAEQQVAEVIKAVKQILPLSIEEVEMTVEIPAKYSGRVHGAIREYGTSSEQWVGQILIIRIKIPAGLKEKFYSHMAGITENNARISEKK
jgi:ribosome maturation protein SDO1